MRVKVGDTWYEPKPNQGVAVELTPADKLRVVQMPVEADRYAAFDRDDQRGDDERQRWLNE